MFSFIALQYYRLTYYIVMAIFCFVTGLSYATSQGCTKLMQRNSSYFAIAWGIIIILYIGLRPLSGHYFVDMIMYNHLWNMFKVNEVIELFDFRSEWFFRLILSICKSTVPSATFWFLVIEVFYVGSQIWACKKLLFENVWMAMLFVCFSSPFFTYGTNGVRNGMGCAMMMLALAFFCDRNRRGYTIGTFIFILAMGCHRTVMLPMAALMGSLFVVKDTKSAIKIWILCIFLSAVGGTFFQNIILGMGLDERMDRYGANDNMDQFSHVGFRWDFLLYSSLPILLCWQVVRKKIYDATFTLIANTYILSNAVWVLVCRVAYSNRFAYLSWFLYGLVIAYTIIRVPIWKNQDRAAGLILMASACATIILGNM